MDAFRRQAATAGLEHSPRGFSSVRRRWPSILSLVLLCIASAHPPPPLHGGRDIFYFLDNPQFFLPSFSGVQVAYGQVVGVDLGSEFVKVALVAAGRPMEIILNAASKRKTSHAVSFADSEKRDMGDEGAAAASKRPDHVFMHSNLFLGLNAADVDSSFTVEASSPSCTRKGERAEEEGGEENKTEDASSSSEACSAEEQPRFLPLKLQAEQSLLQEVGYPHAYYPYRLYADRRRHTVAFLAREGMYLSAEMVTANFLSYLRKMAAQAANVPPTAAIGVVISVPCRFSQRQRQALRDAAEIAGLRPISLVHHAAAAATQHALDTPLPSSTGSSSSNSGSSSKAGGTAPASEQSEGGAKAAAAANGGGTVTGRSTKLFVDVGSTAVDFSLVRFEPVPLNQPSKTTKKAATGGDAASTSGPQTLSVQMLSCETLYGIGGHNVDIGIAELMREAFQKRYPAQGDLRQTPRALKKLLRQAVLSKHILSANKKTQFSVEGLLTTESGAELDLHELVDRSHVESVLERMQLRARMQQALQKTLQQAQLELKDIDQVELLGGGWRVPHVQQELSAVLDGRLPGMHLNGDEAMATGAAFIAANNTVTFRVKKYYLTDVTPYEYSLKITYRPASAAAAAAAGDEAAAQHQQGGAEEQVDENNGQQQEEGKTEKETQEVVDKMVTLFARNTKFGGAPTTKTVSVRTAEDLTVQLLEDGAVIETISVRGVPEAVAKQQQAAAAANRTQEAENKQRQEQQQQETGEGGAAAAPEAAGSSSSKVVEVLGDPKISLVFAVDGCGVLTFDRAYASFTVQSTEEVPASPKTAGAAAESGGATAAAAAGGSETPAAAASGAAGEAEQSSSSGSNAGEAGTEAKAKKEEEEKSKEDATQAAATTKIQKRKQVVEALRGEKVLALPLPLNQEEKRQLREQLLELEAADLQVHLFSEAINRLESFIYATRSALDEAPVMEVMQAEDVEKLRQRLQDDEDYLYSKAKEEGLEAVKKRQQELEDIVIPIRNRAAERTARPQVVKAVDEGLAAAASRLQRAVELLEQHKNWPPEDKIQKAQQVIENLEKWWGEKREEQEKRKDWEDPAFTQAETRKKLRELEAALKAVEDAPKPAPPSSTGSATGGKKSSAAAAARRKRAAREAAAAGDKEKSVPGAAGPEDAEQQQQEEGEGKEEAAEAAGAEDKKDSEFAAGEAEGGGAASVDSGSETPAQEQQQQQETQEGGEKAEQEGKQAESQQEKTTEYKDEL